MTFLKPCQWTVWASNRSGRRARPTFVSSTWNSSPSLAQNIGAECWALFFWANACASVRPGRRCGTRRCRSTGRRGRGRPGGRQPIGRRLAAGRSSRPFRRAEGPARDRRPPRSGPAAGRLGASGRARPTAAVRPIALSRSRRLICHGVESAMCVSPWAVTAGCSGRCGRRLMAGSPRRSRRRWLGRWSMGR